MTLLVPVHRNRGIDLKLTIVAKRSVTLRKLYQFTALCRYHGTESPKKFTQRLLET